MHHIVYQSTALGHLTANDLRSLLRQCRANNLRNGITGLLLYCNGNFLQVLEGPPEPVRQLYENIRADLRHTSVVTLSDGPVERRIFMDWTMGFQYLSGEDFNRLVGYINPFRSDFLDAHLPEVDESVLSLLKSFVRRDHPHF